MADTEVTDGVEAQVVEAEQKPEPEAQAEEHVTVTIGDEESPPSEDERAPDWVRELRKNYRESQRRIRELEEAHATKDQPQDGDPGEKPKLKDFEYDEEAHEKAMDAWYAKKSAYDDAKRKKQEAADAEKTAWQARLDAYGKSKDELKVPDFEDAEASAKDVLSVTQQGVILHGSENPALLVYAIGRSPKKLKELSSIEDPVKFAFAVAKLETQLKVAPRKSAPPPERKVESTASVSGAVDSQLERLRAEAERTGNYTKVVEYQRGKRRQA